ncbi:phospholipase D family protein [Massilia violaceinigra]|uniref:Phospholipase D family protein n=1 Tax=Massilia violaceinigra TaxID=2045208 RepID=A0ABY4A7E9_9BURK|nr:phospholipase D family protein [Massilia violaceinigra]UOD29486.1 phospholipase D family protein [Massilia violaceinigra]
MKTSPLTSLLAALLLLAATLSGCASLPPLDGRTPSHYLAATPPTRLGTALAPLNAAHPGMSGLYSLASGRDAFAARAMLANAAERTLDIQYYIWRNDSTGLLLFNALRAAAQRGVRVRLLLDDNNTRGLDPILAALDADPNIEVRLFNPFVLREHRALGYLSDFSRLNRRMHNKSFTADNAATIIGGRNVGDEYFGADGSLLFIDLDVMAVGPVVDAVSRDFDRYWNSRSAYPVGLLVAPAGAADPLDAQAGQGGAALGYVAAVRASPFVEQLVARTLPFEWANTTLVSDDPDKVLGKEAPDTKVTYQLKRLLGDPTETVDLVSPYFVPGKTWAANFSAMAARGMDVHILTNSLEATDVAAVHAGYAKWRKPLLEAGVTLYEFHRGVGAEGAPPATRGSKLGSAATTLHAKTFSVDRKRVFIGSFNFDPRSADLNTEMGFVIESPAMATRMAAALRAQVPARAYRVRLAPDGALYWTERVGESEIRHDTEPGTGFWKRAAVGLLSLLPIDWLL